MSRRLAVNSLSNGQRPDGARRTLWPELFARYAHPNAMKAVEKYAAPHMKAALALPQMSLALYKLQRFF